MSSATFPQYERPSGWNALLPSRREQNRLRDDVDCDVAIVGAGFTGLSVAARWAELDPGASIVLLDASQPDEGSAGRNSGFLLEIALANDADPAAIERMRECNALISATMEDLRVTVASSPEPCRLQRTGTYRAAAGPEGLAEIERYKVFLEAMDLPFDEFDRSALKRRIGTDYYARGLYSPHCYLAQPAALVRALIAALPPNVTLYEQTPVIRIGKSDTGWNAYTSSAAVHAEQLVLANNAFAKGLGIGRSRVATIYTYAGLTEPCDPEVLRGLGRDTNWGLLPAHRLGSTLRRTDDGRLLIRSSYGYEAEADNASVSEMLAERLRRRFPQLADVRFSSVWSGATGFTLGGAPLWGTTAPGLHVSAGCNGGGIVKGTLFGRLLAEQANGLEVPDIKALFGSPRWMPPEPFRRLGFHLVSAMETRRGTAEI